MDDFAIIGSGIGGASSALFLSKNFQTTLYEKEPILGGCASTFRHQKSFYNAGATTFAGYQKNSYMYELFHNSNVHFKTQKLFSALCVIKNGTSIERCCDLDAFLEQINAAFYHPKNKEFYTLILSLQQRFLAINSYVYSNASLAKKLRSLTSFTELFKAFYPYLFSNAKLFVFKFFGSISSEYLDYLDNQLLIVAQAKLHEVNFLTAALALGYQFLENHYVFGGMGSIFSGIENVLPHVQKKTFIEKITKHNHHYTLHSAKGDFEAKNIVLNTSLFDALPLFDDVMIRRYIKGYQPLNSHLSAFVLYLKIKPKSTLKHHYQIIVPHTIKHTVSNSIFVSIADENDEVMAGSVTVSVHTSTRQWEHEAILEQKMELEAIIEQIICEHLGLHKEDIVNRFSATPHTFKRYINRATLGGIPMRFENFLFKLPSNDTPIKGLYNVGDTTFAAQGWPGVMMGVQNLQRLLCKHA